MGSVVHLLVLKFSMLSLSLSVTFLAIFLFFPSLLWLCSFLAAWHDAIGTHRIECGDDFELARGVRAKTIDAKISLTQKLTQILTQKLTTLWQNWRAASNLKSKFDIFERFLRLACFIKCWVVSVTHWIAGLIPTYLFI